MNIRSATRDDSHHWSRMRDCLWPESRSINTSEIENFFSNSSNYKRECFLIEDKGSPIGFIELNIRNHAEGSIHVEIPYVEGWYIDQEFRGKGLGRKLMAQAQAWATQHGFAELASDAEIDNGPSIMAHKKLGFKEKARIVCFLKELT